MRGGSDTYQSETVPRAHARSVSSRTENASPVSSDPSEPSLLCAAIAFLIVAVFFFLADSCAQRVQRTEDEATKKIVALSSYSRLQKL